MNSRIKAVVTAGLFYLTMSGAANGQDPRPMFAPWRTFSIQEMWGGDVFQSVTYQEGLRGTDLGPTQPFDDPWPTGEQNEQSDSVPSVLQRYAQGGMFSPTAGGTTGGEATARGITDSAQLLTQSNNVQGVNSQQRNPITIDPHIRGYHVGQIYATSNNGEYWMPVRNDLDTVLSKIDPRLIKTATVIPGPYTSIYGPGLSFIDVAMIDTPRYDAFEFHNRINATSRTNGGQLFATETVLGGNSDWGFIVNYGSRTGSDYQAGNGIYVPASYNNKDVLFQLGADLTDNTRTEFRYQRQDLTNAEYPLQFFDVAYQGTDSFSGSVITADDGGSNELRTDLWYNYSRFHGDTSNGSKRNSPFNVVNRVEQALANQTGIPGNTADFIGYTNGNIMSTGGRVMKTYGDSDSEQLRVGTDLRYLKQYTFEEFNWNYQVDPNPTPPPYYTATTSQPQSNLIDPGLFAEYKIPVWTAVTTTLGGRIDWAHTTAEDVNGENDFLMAGFGTTNIDLTENWSTAFSLGYAERVPTLTERYSEGLFLSMFQSGFTRVIGNPLLDKERALQADVSLSADYDFLRGSAGMFCSWIGDYVTYEANQVVDPLGALLVRSVNTDLATLTGFALRGEADVTQRWTVVTTLEYVQGQDQQIGAPLPQISPLEGRVALQWANTSPEKAWGFEAGARMVAGQYRLGTLRLAGTSGTTVVETNTPGFTTCYVRANYDVRNNLHLIGGIDNLFDRGYYEHLSLRLPADGPKFPFVAAYLPGITPYFGCEWTF